MVEREHWQIALDSKEYASIHPVYDAWLRIIAKRSASLTIRPKLIEPEIQVAFDPRNTVRTGVRFPTFCCCDSRKTDQMETR